MELSARVEALLFYKAEPVAIDRLVVMLGVSKEEIMAALEVLRARYDGTGLSLMQNGEEVMLATASGASELIETLIKEELSREIGKAGIETLSIVLYRGPVTRSEIDYVRGVNSNFMLRALMTRGLVERVADPAGGRVPLYRPTFELLSHLGVTRAEDLPDYEAVREELVAFEAGKEDPALGTPAPMHSDETAIDQHEEMMGADEEEFAAMEEVIAQEELPQEHHEETT
ncbi:MAG: hypothetical protein A2408_03995 [Candidatus Yonathbacteria bacterium RIFOXYC1_FULL_52_10]|uniref:SMC-Scp complex subunit ScpB n=1 Tax=Candidatus Yonathbacteria bacterium RIFOXYD1_FULL_52_36 TaxID=1802730 RepID=A0A1G2SN17_9BACT|nr:MAG: hypothetical protein A2408_03995 [Candidatus Yonathbacteria bacterium RIFOXYC1_FULL_52_10]OHA86192.1 MAG: hypothetical protein A2591_03870 [Candidatus Yonathbacteria bacterium RIFOXYD1_FULL_52_36]